MMEGDNAFIAHSFLVIVLATFLGQLIN